MRFLNQHFLVSFNKGEKQSNSRLVCYLQKNTVRVALLSPKNQEIFSCRNQMTLRLCKKQVNQTEVSFHVVIKFHCSRQLFSHSLLILFLIILTDMYDQVPAFHEFKY